MKRAAWLLGLAGLAGCGLNERPTYTEPEPLPIEVPVPEAERFLRHPPNYVYRDPADAKEYLIHAYSEGETDYTLVEVQEPGRAPRAASSAEAAYAFDHYRRECLEATPAAQLMTARRRVDAENRRNATLIDDQLYHTTKVIAELEGDLADMKAELASLPAAGGKSGDGHRMALQARMQQTQVLLIGAMGRQAVLRQKKAARDGAPAAGDGIDDLLEGR